MKYALTLLTVIMTAGCSTYSKRQCQEMQWYGEGQKAALAGYTLKQGKTHFIDKCQEDQGVAPDFVDFDRGFSAGLNKLCSPEGRQKMEDKGIKYQGTCESVEENKRFEQNRVADLEEKLHELTLQNKKLEKEIEAMKENPCP